jgi:hypothetical protein
MLTRASQARSVGRAMLVSKASAAAIGLRGTVAAGRSSGTDEHLSIEPGNLLVADLNSDWFQLTG